MIQSFKDEDTKELFETGVCQALGEHSGSCAPQA